MSQCEAICRSGERCKAGKVDEHFCYIHSPAFEADRAKNRGKAHDARRKLDKLATMPYECDGCDLGSKWCEHYKIHSKCKLLEKCLSIDIDNDQDVKNFVTKMIGREMASFERFKRREMMNPNARFDREVSRAAHRLSQILEVYHNMTQGRIVNINVKKEAEVDRIKETAQLYLKEAKAKDWDTRASIRKKIKEMTV